MFSSVSILSVPTVSFTFYTRTTVNSRTCCARHSRAIVITISVTTQTGGFPACLASLRKQFRAAQAELSSISRHPSSLGIGYCKVLAVTCRERGAKRVYSAVCATPFHRRVVSGLRFSTRISPLFVEPQPRARERGGPLCQNHNRARSVQRIKKDSCGVHSTCNRGGEGDFFLFFFPLFSARIYGKRTRTRGRTSPDVLSPSFIEAAIFQLAVYLLLLLLSRSRESHLSAR